MNKPHNIPATFPPVPSRFDKIREKWDRMRTFLHFRYLVWCGYITMDCEPLRCENCDHYQLSERTVDYCGGYPCEVEVYCPHCGTRCGYWAYGYWEPMFV